MTDHTIRPGSIADLEAVMIIMEDSFDPRFGEAWTSLQLSGLMPMPGVWLTIAEEAGEPIGFALARSIADEAELLLIAVRNGRQRKGIGTALIDDFVRGARRRGAERVHLEVRDGNPAVSLYLARGFAACGRRADYYEGDDGICFDALTLAKQIAPE